MLNKRGYEYKFSAPLVAVAIGVLMLVYLYFLPVNDKCNLIPGLGVCSGETAEKIITMNPGHLIPQEVSKRYSIPNVELFRLESVDIATIFNQAEISRGWFFSDERTADFSVPGGAQEAKLFIFIGSGKGSLNVIVNGNTIARVSGDGVKQIPIPLKILKENNELKLASTVPFMPWSTTSYSISKVVLRESYTKTTNKFSYNVELKQDVHEIEKALIDFNSQCFSDESLTVTLNGNKIVDDRICNGFKRDIKSYLRMNNTLVFMTDGNYFINDAYVDVTTKDRIWPTYYFDVPAGNLKSGKQTMLTLDFNGTGNKELSIYINGDSISAATNKLEWKTTIGKFLVEGQNSIMFVPKTEVTISSAEVQ